MKLNDTVVSLIRTWVPVVVGAGLTWVAKLFPSLEGQLDFEGATLLAVTIVTAAYYALARALEKKVPWLGWMLGVPSEPAYAGTPPAGPAPSELT